MYKLSVVKCQQFLPEEENWSKIVSEEKKLYTWIFEDLLTEILGTANSVCFADVDI